MHYRECFTHESDDKSSAEYIRWRTNHDGKCNVNHEVSAEKMEKQSAIDIFCGQSKTKN